MILWLKDSKEMDENVTHGIKSNPYSGRNYGSLTNQYLISEDGSEWERQ